MNLRSGRSTLTSTTMSNTTDNTTKSYKSHSPPDLCCTILLHPKRLQRSFSKASTFDVFSSFISKDAVSMNNFCPRESPGTKWIDNPFEGDFNPGDSLGQKLFIEATSFDIKDENKINISFDNTSKVLALLNDLCNRFGWSKIVQQRSGGEWDL